MTLRPIPAVAALLAAVAISSLSVPALAVPITFNGGGADLTFYYDSTDNSWATVFRAKGTEGQPTTATATGLTAPFNSTSTPATWAGTVGNVVPAANGDTGDYTFTTLTTNIATATQRSVTTSGTTTSYYVASASNSTINPTTPTADLGIRTRLRQNLTGTSTSVPPATDQFASFNLTLNPAASTFNGSPLVGSGAFVSLLHWDANSDPVAMIDSAAGLLTANFGNYAHVHRNWGFSQYGEYSLAFNLQGVGGTYGDTAAIGTTTIGFVTAVPEPGTVSLAALGLLGAAGGFRWLRRRGRPAVAEASAESLDA
jgi:surface-anchored protein